MARPLGMCGHTCLPGHIWPQARRAAVCPVSAPSALLAPALRSSPPVSFLPALSSACGRSLLGRSPRGSYWMRSRPAPHEGWGDGVPPRMGVQRKGA